MFLTSSFRHIFVSLNFKNQVMKNKILLFSLMITMFSYASETSSFSKKNGIKKTIIISLDNVKQGQLLYIKDYSGVILYNEVLEKNGTYNKNFNLSALPLGDYYFELDKDMEIKVIPFKVEIDKVEIFTEMETLIFKPMVKSKENKVYLSRLSMNNEPLKVNIYYEGSNDKELIFSEKIENRNIVERIYALDKQQRGLYKIIVLTEGRTFSHVIAL